MEIKQQKNEFKLVETDRNGTFLFENKSKERKKFSIRNFLKNPEIINQINSRDAFSIGYKIGFNEGLKIPGKKLILKKLFYILRNKTIF